MPPLESRPPISLNETNVARLVPAVATLTRGVHIFGRQITQLYSILRPRVFPRVLPVRLTFFGQPVVRI